jgi:hypothetical protein
MTSTKIARRQRDAGMVAAAAREHAAEAAERVEPLLARVAAEGEAFGLQRLQEALGLLLDDARRALEVADGAHIEEERDDIAARERRDRAAATLHQRLVGVRAACDRVYGPGADTRLLGLRGRTARHPEELRLQARRVIHRLRDPEAPLPPPPALALAPDPSSWAAHLEGPLTDLETALRRVHRDRRARETTLCAKHEAIRRFDRTQSAVTSLLAALYRLAELDAFEERLRPRRGRPRSRSSEAARSAAGRDGIATIAAEGGPPDHRESFRAAADEPAGEPEPSAAAAGGPGAVAAFPATAAYSSCDFSGTSSPVAHEGSGFFEPSATAARSAGDGSGATGAAAPQRRGSETRTGRHWTRTTARSGRVLMRRVKELEPSVRC